MSAGTVPRRAVVLVGGPAAPYSRAIRIARALAAEGFSVEIAAVAAAGLPDREDITGPAAGSSGDPQPQPADIGLIELRRYRASGPWSFFGASDAAATGGAATERQTSGRHRPAGARRVLRTVARPLLALRRWIFWPHAVRGWWATLARDLAPADLYHACGTLAIAAALAARDRAPIGPSGRPARVIYDAIDDAAESNDARSVPGPLRRRHARTEGAWARSADAVVTVNDGLSERLGGRWRLDRAPLVVTNAPEPPAADLPAARPRLLHEASGLAPEIRVVLFQGRLGPGLGLDEAAEGVLLVPGAALVLLGFGRGFDAALARDAEPRFLGRHITLPARNPDELLAWTASADVALIPLPPVSVNQRLSTPNKFWEAIAAGTPVVVVTGLEIMERLVVEHDLGAVAASTSPVDLAAAIQAVLARLDAPDGDDWRARIARIGAEEFGWPAQATAYRALVRDVAGSTPT